MNPIQTSPPAMIGTHGPADLLGAAPTPMSPGGETLAQEDFASVLKSMLVDVSQSQQQSNQLAAAFERGQHQDLAEVMIAQQKSRLAFQTTLQVRNKLVSAYQDIMNMPV
ncbi:MAG: flagellar hook-basal body complex protein FliE [Synechococcaceae cyanobacterium SM1_2_3]|nr:flagellar hook-basal body complex protein FliE [Synechococcaceae cyanobacterium SM1_2_3]